MAMLTVLTAPFERVVFRSFQQNVQVTSSFIFYPLSFIVYLLSRRMHVSSRLAVTFLALSDKARHVFGH